MNIRVKGLGTTIRNQKDTHRDGQPDAVILSDYGSLVVEMLDVGPTPSPILLLTVVNFAKEDL